MNGIQVLNYCISKVTSLSHSSLFLICLDPLWGFSLFFFPVLLFCFLFLQSSAHIFPCRFHLPLSFQPPTSETHSTSMLPLSPQLPNKIPASTAYSSSFSLRLVFPVYFHQSFFLATLYTFYFHWLLCLLYSLLWRTQSSGLWVPALQP